MTHPDETIALPLGMPQERSLAAPPQGFAGPHRVIQRPGPPPSRQPRPNLRRVPTGPPQATIPPLPPPPPVVGSAAAGETGANQRPETDEVDIARPHPLLMASVSASVAVAVFGILLCGLFAFAKSQGFALGGDEFTVQEGRPSPGGPDGRFFMTSTLSAPPTETGVDVGAGNATSRLEDAVSAAALLEDRFYHLQTDENGNVVAARMPLDDRNRRFGPEMDEAEALAKLPHLRRLDLRGTIGSVAVPIANRNPAVKILVLEDQCDAESLLKLRGPKELHLVNSSIDAAKLSYSGIKVVQMPAR